MFIAFEGIDGAGKTTISHMVKEALEWDGHRVFLTKEPTPGIEWTDQLKKARDARSGLILFFRFTEDRFTHQDEIKRHIAADEIVLCDRYLMSSLAYQGALIEKLFNSRQETIDWMLQVSSIIKVRPDVTFYIDVDPEVSIARLKNRGALTGFEEAEYLKEVRALYKGTKINGNKIVDGSGSLDATYNMIMNEIRQILRR